MPKMRWVLSSGFVANFIRFPEMQNFENRLRFDKVTESSKVGTFLRHNVVSSYISDVVKTCITKTKTKTMTPGFNKDQDKDQDSGFQDQKQYLILRPGQ